MKKIVLIIALGITPLAYSMEPVEAPVPAHRPEVVRVVGAPAQAQEELSIQDLIDRDELPGISENGEIDLSDEHLTSLIGLENIPNPEQITELDLGGNKIVYIQPHAFDRFVNLKYLDLTDNPIIRIEPHLFDLLVNLEELHLEGTFITEIPPHAFDTLRKLKVLHLFRNKLDSLPAGTLNNLHDLEEFDIQNNKLIALDSNLFSNQEKLERIFLNRNMLTLLPTITHLTTLKELHFANNKGITELSPEVIAFLREHKIGCDMPELLGETPPYSAGQLVADLGDNWANILVGPDPITGDIVLNLDNRGLTDLSGLPLELNLMQIAKISAKNNFIKRIPADIFYREIPAGEEAFQTIQMFQNIDYIDLSNNMIEDLNLSVEGYGWTNLRLAKHCPYLIEIDLSNNKITQIPMGVFSGLRSLLLLDLYNNQISAIADGAFNGLRNLYDLNLGSNKLHILPRTIFKNLYRLNDLVLTHNNLGNKEQYVFPPKADVEFYPQEIPMLKLLAAKQVAAGFEGKNILGVYKAMQAIPAELHEAILTAASKNVALKIYYANKINWFFNLVAKKPGILQGEIMRMWPKDMQEALLAVAPDELREKLIQSGFGSNVPALGGHRVTRGIEPEAGEESEEETFEFPE